MTEVQFVQPDSVEHDQALDLRTAAFFVEHGGRSAAESRDRPGADHAVIIGAGRVIACGQGHVEQGAYHISQMAVETTHRRSGLGTAILEALLERARERRVDVVRLEARHHVTGFYARHGFVRLTVPRPIGDTGVPHVAMELRVT